MKTRKPLPTLTLKQRQLVSFAARRNMTPEQTIALPEAVTVAARKCGMTEQMFIYEMTSNRQLGDYIISVCSLVMSGLQPV